MVNDVPDLITDVDRMLGGHLGERSSSRVERNGGHQRLEIQVCRRPLHRLEPVPYLLSVDLRLAPFNRTPYDLLPISQFDAVGDAANVCRPRSGHLDKPLLAEIWQLQD